MSSRFVVVGLALVALVWAHRRWREAVQATLVLLVLEGALRKWVFPGAQDLVYFGKDVLLLGVYSGFLYDRRRPKIRAPSRSAPSFPACRWMCPSRW